MRLEPESIKMLGALSEHHKLAIWDLNLTVKVNVENKLEIEIHYVSNLPEYADEMTETAVLQITAEDFKKAVDQCETNWKEFVKMIATSPQLSLQKMKNAVDSLVRVGKELRYVLLQGGGTASTDDREKLSRLTKYLTESADGLRILVRSEQIHVPWNLFYLGSNDGHRGFLGYRHEVVEKVEDRVGILKGRKLQEFGEKSPFQFSLQRNLELKHYSSIKAGGASPTYPKGGVEALIEMLKPYVTPQFRDNRAAFLKALQPPTAQDDFIYFICHGDFDDSKVYFLKFSKTDNNLYATDVAVELNQNPFPRQPLVFLNACFGGSGGTVPYAKFTETFLGHGANAIIGPILEVPASLAIEFARNFFAELFGGDSHLPDGSLRTIPDVLFGVRRAIMDVPEGPDLSTLLYSVSIRRRAHFPWQFKIPDSSEQANRASVDAVGLPAEIVSIVEGRTPKVG
jgi:hypothetical protein